MILAAALGALGFLVCLLDWRRGLLLSLLVGFAQDPLRKVVPGQPVAFVMLVAVYFTACAVGYFFDQGLGGIRRFFSWYPGLRIPLTVFIVVVFAQAVATILRTGSLILAGIGLLSYLSPLVALLVGQRFLTTVRDIGRWQKVYLAGALVVSGSILLAFVGFRSPLFASVGVETVFGRGGRVEMVCGLMRSSEISAWHCATAACLMVIWSVARRGTRAFWFGAAATLALLLAVVLTGRRKTLGEVLLFLVFFGFLLGRSRIGASRFLKVASGVVIGAAIAAVFLASGGEDSRWNPYLQRGYSVIQDAPERLNLMVGKQLYWVVLENGFFGKGAGTGAQGAQYFGGGSELVGGGAEGGLGRILAELGVPGLAVAIWLFLAIGARLLRLSRALAASAPQHALRYFGLVALIPANAVVFLTAHQVFGDPFVLIVLGFIASSALAFPQIVVMEQRLALRPQAAGPSTARRVPVPG